ncbi:MAG: hypothetical protein JNM56_34855 [Planctomycetia bacterium]|nr:hypothetical protein [Planctomycetia bacterium]
MNTIELIGQVSEQHQLLAAVPSHIRPGLVKIILEVPDDIDGNEMANDWAKAVAHAWAADWSDPREDIYTLNDGKPVQ